MRIVLASMPWAIFNRPSIQMGALKSYLQTSIDDGVVQSRHIFLEVAQKIGLTNYRIISENSWAGEALYSALLFPEQRTQAGKLFKQELQGQCSVEFEDLLVLLDEQLQTWIDRENFDDCALLGFTVCFSQLPSTLFACRKIKEHWPDLPIALGGSTCTPSLGRSLLDVFPELDFIITGEGERPLAGLIRFLAGSAPFPGNNVLGWNAGKQPLTGISTPADEEIQDLNTLPIPDYDDYFNELKASRLSFIPELPLEFSRGCWWNKCTFCNLNLQWCGYRYKKHDRMLKEQQFLQQRYQCLDFTFTDNALPLREADRFFQDTAKNDSDLRFFGEIRALRKPATYELYQKGGLRSVQVGIEALSNSLLKRMRKGVSVMDNVTAMKFAAASGMVLDGNLILEFPGATEDEVLETLEVLDFVLPFRPLQAAAFFLGHGSPVCNQPKKYAIKAVTQHANNRKLYPKTILDRLDLLIKSYRGDRQHQAGIWQPVREKIHAWHTFHEKRTSSLPPLSYRDGSDFLIIRQELPGLQTLHHRLRGLSRKIYLSCEEPVAKKELLQNFKQIKMDQFLSFLSDLEQKKLLFTDTDSCLALAVRQNS
ncbi:MAG: RiPP maturation radical SAM protein 1 [Desulfobulbaceae bacterium]|nr:RiPP maturation radical SAM protein 1 [Desulfobulbaceae bacterium]